LRSIRYNTGFAMADREQPETEPAEILREYGPFPDASQVHGVTFDGRSIWVATGSKLQAVSPTSGHVERVLDVPAQAGSAFDGRYLFQIAGPFIQKIEPDSGAVLAKIQVPCATPSGMSWAEGSLWVGEYSARKIHQVDPATGAIVRTIESDRFVTGVTWVDGELWHGAIESDQGELRQIDAADGQVKRRIAMPAGAWISGLESDGGDVFYCGGGTSGKVRAVRRSKRR
jgi:hypothetical protein